MMTPSIFNDVLTTSSTLKKLLQNLINILKHRIRILRKSWRSAEWIYYYQRVDIIYETFVSNRDHLRSEACSWYQLGVRRLIKSEHICTWAYLIPLETGITHYCGVKSFNSAKDITVPFSTKKRLIQDLLEIQKNLCCW